MMITSTKDSTMPADILEVLNAGGELTREQLKRLIVYEAGLLDLDYDEAVELARNNELPKNALGTSVQYMIQMLDH